MSIRNKLKVQDLCAYDQNMTVGELVKQLKEERPYICPKCNGTGSIYIPAEENYCMGGYHNESSYKECDICNGYGRTEKKYVPEYKVTGYKEVSEQILRL